MLFVDAPYVPAPETTIVLAQSDVTSAAPPADFILNACQETEHTTDPRSALRGVDPAGMLAIYIQHRDTRYVKPAEIQNITMLQGTKHGKIFSEIDNVGLTSYHYDPEPGYLGDDQAIFMAEFQGKRYKIVVDIKVLIVVDESASQCGQPQLIKITNPSSGNSGFGSGYNLVSVFVSYRPNPALKRDFAKAALLLRPLLLRWGNRNA